MSLLKSFPALTLVFISLYGCQNNTRTVQNTDSVSKEISGDNILDTGKTDIKNIPDSTNSSPGGKVLLVLTSNAIQLVDRQTGSSKEINFGIPLTQMVEITGNVLEMEPSSIGINQECGAGPLQMASWSNGLTLVFKQTKNQKEWKFAGWYMGKSPGTSKTLTTMAGIGIGSTRAEMESAYVIEVSKTTLGHEFSTSSGLYGIFDGSGKDARISSLWSGLSCNFR